ncbi:hypothetical protein DICPUDRAFT_149089 [Dictyostelium purpureum]|uniref:Uncharacterized protein n=1 Tax=Dictyostelium purpureum TaxID=5786 RepID=F0ZCT8_DICPU|nr:uncharacterized protein DICPUDRAFT_149089 [Dictyostelium purpureum]EGC38276.1 hypothetical protein DICPUDRAFT_149089 [Dictyostelium purpureum]|eukprot:XP_003285233.1 hypothetical protein DICPUDRAFT_149089 [Dictyostelium purpureum]
MTKTDDIPVVYIEKRNINQKIHEIDVDKQHRESIAKTYEFIVEQDKIIKEHKVLSEALDQCFFKQKQSYIKNCREIALQYLELAAKIDKGNV